MLKQENPREREQERQHRVAARWHTPQLERNMSTIYPSCFPTRPSGEYTSHRTTLKSSLKCDGNTRPPPFPSRVAAPPSVNRVLFRLFSLYLICTPLPLYSPCAKRERDAHCSCPLCTLLSLPTNVQFPLPPPFPPQYIYIAVTIKLPIAETAKTEDLPTCVKTTSL